MSCLLLVSWLKNILLNCLICIYYLIKIKALIWQLMKAYVISLLQKLTDDGKPIGDNEIIQWANEKVFKKI